MCSAATPMPAQMASRRPVPAESCPPVMAVVSLSEMTMVTLEFSFTQSSNPVMPEWVKVAKWTQFNENEMPLYSLPLKIEDAPQGTKSFAIVMEAPMSTQELMALKGALAPKV